MRLHESRGPGDDHRADRLAAARVGIVVDLDAPRRRRKPEGFAERGEQFLLARVLGELSRQGLARIGQRMLDELTLLAALRRRDLHPFLHAHIERVLEHLAVLDLVRKQNERRGRVLAVKLREKGRQHLGFGKRLVGARIISAIAPVLIGAKEEGLDAETPGVLGDREDVRLLDASRIDALRALDRRKRRNAVSEPRGALELQSFGGLRHLLRQPLAHRAAFSGQKILRLLDENVIVLDRDLAGAGAGAALDLIEQAGTRAVFVKRVRAGAQKKGALQRVQRAIDRPDAGEGTEIIALARARAAMLADLRGAVIARDQNIGERLVVAHQHVEARLQLLDQIGFEQQRVGLGRNRDEHHRRGCGDHARNTVHMAGEARVARDPLPDVLRLADVEHLAVLGDHAIDAGAVRRVPPLRLDDLDAALQALGRVRKIAGAFFDGKLGLFLDELFFGRRVV